TRVVLPGGEFVKDLSVDRPLLTRVIHDPNSPLESDRALWGGCGVTLSQADARVLLDTTSDWRREMEMSTGSFALGEWKEFTKRFGYMVLWAFAEQRLAALIDAAVHVEYRTADDQAFLYAIALYDHHEHRRFTDGLSGMADLSLEKSDPVDRQDVTGRLPSLQRWVQREGGALVAKLTLTAYQLIVECDSPQRLDHVKHRLAAALGFSLHFRGETVVAPTRLLSVAELTADTPPRVVVTSEEEKALLNQFLETTYLEWSDQPHVALGGQTPRHAAASPALQGKVGELILDMERYDLGRQRGGKPAFNYNRLRAHVGLDELPE
nr:hypothetical protein [Nitrospira sp.]